MSKLQDILFALRNPSDDEHSDSNSEISIDSGDLSHIPIPEFDCELDKLTINEMEPIQQNNQPAPTLEQVLEGLANQITTLNITMQQIASKQNAHETLLQGLAPSTANIENNSPAVAQPVSGDVFRIPDPIKAIPTYDGSRKQLQSWIMSVENTLKIFKSLVSKQTYEIYVQVILNKITGNAKDAVCLAGNPQTFEEVKEILSQTFGDRQELATYKAQLWSNKQGNELNFHKYYKRTKEIVQNIKTIARQNNNYNQNWTVICQFIDEDALAAFIAGLRHPYFGYAQAAKPDSVESAYAFLCKFTSAEKISATANYQIKNQTQNQNQNQTKYNKQDDTGRHQKYPKDNYHKNPKPINQPKQDEEKMEVDPSVRSRLTLNRKIINNNEISSDEEEASDAESNFFTIPASDNET